MFQTIAYADGSLKYSIRHILNISAMSMALFFSGSCAEGTYMNNCSYIDAFGEDAELTDLTVSKAHADAKKFIMEGRIALMGGYLDTGPITLPLYKFSEKYPSDKFQHLVEKFGVEKVEKIFPTKRLDSMKSGNILYADDGVIDDKQVERECYNSSVRAYAIEFNNVIFSEALKD